MLRIGGAGVSDVQNSYFWTDLAHIWQLYLSEGKTIGKKISR